MVHFYKRMCVWGKEKEKNVINRINSLLIYNNKKETKRRMWQREEGRQRE